MTITTKSKAVSKPPVTCSFTKTCLGQSVSLQQWNIKATFHLSQASFLPPVEQTLPSHACELMRVACLLPFPLPLLSPSCSFPSLPLPPLPPCISQVLFVGGTMSTLFPPQGLGQVPQETQGSVAKHPLPECLPSCLAGWALETSLGA